MGLFELFLIAVGLSMDAFAVAVCKGLCMRKMRYGQAVVIAVFFGGFQALMPLIGWMLGRQFEKYITSIDHWIAFVLLALIGGNMIREALGKEEESECATDDRLDIRELFLMAIATSIDALAIGITFAFLQVSIGRQWPLSAVQHSFWPLPASVLERSLAPDTKARPNFSAA